MAVFARRAPRCTIIGIDAHRHPVALEHVAQHRLYCCRVSARASVQEQIEARMIIEQRERMTRPGRRHEVALEVDLPQLVGLGMLESLPGMGCLIVILEPVVTA